MQSQAFFDSAILRFYHSVILSYNSGLRSPRSVELEFARAQDNSLVACLCRVDPGVAQLLVVGCLRQDIATGIRDLVVAEEPEATLLPATGLHATTNTRFSKARVRVKSRRVL